MYKMCIHISYYLTNIEFRFGRKPTYILFEIKKKNEKSFTDGSLILLLPRLDIIYVSAPLEIKYVYTVGEPELYLLSSSLNINCFYKMQWSPAINDTHKRT